MTALKILGGLVIAAIVFFLIAAEFSAVESRLECGGSITAEGAETPSAVFVKLEKYRWWVSLWSDSWGSAWVELPNRSVSYFPHVTKAGDLIQFWDFPGGNFSGNYSTLSGAIGVDLGGFGLFDGSCKSIRQ